MKLICFIFVLTISFLYPSMQTYQPICQDSIQEELAHKLLRLHVIAASDSKEDQELKLLVKDKACQLLGPQLVTCTTKEEATEIITNAIPTLTANLQSFLTTQGSTQTLTISLERTYFPVKLYGDLVFPAGVYDALRIVLNEGKGQNWWCVAYPPLCFTDICTVPTTSKQTLKTMLTEDTWNQLQLKPIYTTTKKSPPKIRFWIVDFFQNLFF